MKIHAMELSQTEPSPAPDPNCRRPWTSRLVRGVLGINGNAEEAPFGRTVSPLGNGAVAQFLWAVPLATLLWVAAAWAMGWLP